MAYLKPSQSKGFVNLVGSPSLLSPSLPPSQIKRQTAAASVWKQNLLKAHSISTFEGRNKKKSLTIAQVHIAQLQKFIEQSI